MVSAWRLWHLTFPAIPMTRGSLSCYTGRLNAGIDVFMPVARDTPWIHEACASVADEQSGHQPVEKVGISFSQWAWFYVVEEPLRGESQEGHEGHHAWVGE